MADEASQFVMEAANGIKEEGTKVMPKTIPDSSGLGVVEAMRTDKQIRRRMLVMWQERTQGE